MIGQLVREHLRAQRAYIIRMGAMVAVAMVLAAIAGITATTSHSHNRLLADVTGAGGEHHVIVSYFDNGVPDLSVDSYINHLPQSEAESLIDSITSTAEKATVSVIAFVPRGAESWTDLSGIDGDVPWDVILIEGRAPQRGEVVLSTFVADAYGVSIGDTITLTGDARIQGATGNDIERIERTTTLTLVGLSRADNTLWSLLTPSGYVHIEEAVALRRTFGMLSGRNSAGEETAMMDFFISWDGPIPAELSHDTDGQGPSDTPPVMTIDISQGSTAISQVTGILSGVVGLGIVVSALALARNEATVRTRWVATARALGARRRHLLTASLAESAAIAMGSLGLALAVAYGGVSIWLARERTAFPELYHVPAPAVPWWLVAGLAAVAGILALTVSVTPAWWAIRTSPVTALKPGPPEVEEPMPRISVRTWGAVAVGSLAMAVILDLIRRSLNAQVASIVSIVWVVAMCAAAVGAGIAVLAVVQRALQSAVTKLETIDAPWSHLAAHSLRTRERQALTIAGLFTVTTGMVVAGHFMHLMSQPPVNFDVSTEPSLPWITDYVSDTLIDLGSFAPIVALAVFAAVIASAVSYSTLATVRDETATHAALGLTRSASSGSRLAFQALPSAMGIVVGAGAGLVLPTILGVINAAAFSLNDHGFSWWFYLLTLMSMATVWVTVVSLLIGLLSSCLVAFGTRERSPVEELTLAMR